MRNFTDDDKKQFNNTIEHVEDVQSRKPNTSAKFVDIDEKLVVAEGEEKLQSQDLCSVRAFSIRDNPPNPTQAMKLVGANFELGVFTVHRMLHLMHIAEVITAMTTAGAFISSLFAGALSDRIGRKWVLVISDICYCIGTIIFGASYSVTQASIGRLILGFGVGFSSCIGPLFISEISPPQLRGTLVTINSVTITLGQCIAYGIGAGLVNFENPENWRIMLVIGAAPAIYQAIAVHFLPESPRYLLAKERNEEAHTALAKVYEQATQEELALKFDILVANVDESVQISKESTTWQLFKSLFIVPKNLRALSLAMTLQAPTLFQMLGFENAPLGGLVIAAANFAFTAVGMFVVNRTGRRPLLVYLSAPGVILGCVWAIVSLYYLTKDSGFHLVEDPVIPYDSGIQVAVIIGFVAYVGAYGIGLGHIPWTMSELFPLETRGLGTGIGTATLWACNLIISESYLSMQKGLTPSGTFAGLHLEEVQSLLTDGFNVHKSVQLRNSKKKALKSTKETALVDVEANSKCVNN
ncbi:hypothetical protein E3P77_00168 [Wallemia ichthyophaga]|nr:hypothetical protein E3P97_00167 [Wallemia ichthyophaga]TIB51441.1 hypothetical protein E3P82_00167 [Wallemia ichthyophaga]TIB57334.1 hypothetical protein E3P80_00167 [Wallemia ichthyophaga]TIB62484.1 hypothetical protein E3P79_00167 [Wallemia ichthyophaga]TIB70129.1 hypothetical protein E3P77_00168 [Wallemia ichthyophaga]